MSVLRPLVRNNKRPTFFSAYARAANRYGFTTSEFAPFKKHENVVNGVSPLQSRVLAEYIVPVKIGTPGITLNLDFDTGSSDLWVWSSQLTGVSKTGHNIYDPAQSKTAQAQRGSTWSISYGDGSSASGTVYLDTVTIGGVAIPGQAVELAQKLSRQFAQGEGSDGLLGLAWPAINTVSPRPVKTPVENMIEQGLVAQPLFTVKLERGNGEDGNAGFYSFGEIEEGVTSSPIVYTDVDSSQGFWTVPSASVVINGKTVERAGNTAILDTGTTLALVDDSTVSAIYAAIPGAKFDQNEGGWMYPASAAVPELQIAIGDIMYTLNKADFPFGEAEEGMLFGGVQSRGSLDFDILGDIFLKSVYVVFNQGNSTVGLAQRDD
ncbi:Acid protease [Mycena kentingensis (nom. inval.)]|nr:Acid protease [Mycena kentingensis (nom. inval.)]